jgi:hypothetical protein
MDWRDKCAQQMREGGDLYGEKASQAQDAQDAQAQEAQAQEVAVQSCGTDSLFVLVHSTPSPFGTDPLSVQKAARRSCFV